MAENYLETDAYIPTEGDIPDHLDRQGNPLAMSLSLKVNPNEIPSAFTHMKQAQKVQKFIEVVKNQIKYEIEQSQNDQ